MVKRLMLEKADRLFHLPPVLSDFLPRKERKKLLGHEVVDLARFRWPSPTETDPDPAFQIPASEEETNQLLEKTAGWYQNRYGVKINPQKEIFIGGNIRLILNLLSLSYFNPGDLVLIPNPGVWHYRAAAILASAETIPYHLSERNGFKPTPDLIANNLARLAKGIILNSPHNPTGAILDKEDLSEILYIAGRENLLLILDQAFEGLSDSDKPTSLFALPGGRKVSLELYSYAYNFGQPLPSIGFAIAQPALISGLKLIAETFGVTLTQQQVNAGLKACDNPNANLDAIRKKFTHNRDAIDQLCKKLRLIPSDLRAGPFCWAKLPGRRQSRRFCRALYLRCGVLTVPGIAFGDNGEGYIRFSLTEKAEAYKTALQSTGKFFQSLKEGRKVNG